MTLSWDPNSDENVAGYKLYYGKSSGNYQYSVDVGNVTNYSISNLPDGERYYFAATAHDFSSNESNFSEEVSYVVSNKPPVADAGPNQTLHAGDEVRLIAANSSDPEGGMLLYQWTQTGGIPVGLSDTQATDVVFIAPNVEPEGESLTFALKVTDEWGAKSQASCTVSIVSANLPPIADAGLQQNVRELEIVHLKGSASKDLDDGVDSYTWTQLSGPAVTLIDPDLADPIFVAPDVDPDGASLTFRLTVRDISGLESSDTCLVNVTWGNASPVADAGPDQQVNAGKTAVLDGSASTDPDDGIASYQWHQTSGTPVALTRPDTAKASFTAPSFDSVLTTLSFELSVTDKGGLRSTKSCNVYVRNRVSNLKKISRWYTGWYTR
ncbi:MAG: PKD domain-containing protein [Desulfoferrobacter sp.]